jgi:hypothetical protein
MSIEGTVNSNLNYLLENYDLNNKELNLLKNELSNIYEIENIISNVIKIEYQMNKYGFDT